ncbi:MAG: carboxypeptidase regulatory-like domain-containing protein, partial [Candidatus Riflebacteria bacterium]|nr:carboxypeptidase regulatory-like domain-containing protein [Candidatus Riflebacteria bacterium]
LDNKTWVPVVGAEVGFTYNEGGQVASVTTDALGNFQIKPLINKPGKLIINAKDFKPLIDSFSARGSGRDFYQYTYKMNHNYWTVSGTLVDYKTNDPAVGVNVKLTFDKSDEKPLEFKTDDKGYYQFNVDIDRPGSLEFSGEGWVTKKDTFSGRGSDAFENWKYELHKTDETFTLTGRVRDYSTKYYIEGAKVSFTYDDGGEVATETDKFGCYTLYPLINKPGKVIVSKDSYITGKTSCSRNDATDKAIEDFTLYHNYWTQTGKVVDYKTGDGVKDATLTFYYEDGSQIDCTTDENGYYKITPENNKKGKMSITCEGYTPRREGETYRGSDDFVVYNYDIKKAQDTYTIVGRVFNDKDKKPVSGATVEYTAKDGTKLTATTDEKGDYILNAPLSQDGSFKVTAKGFKEGKDTIGSKSDSRDRVVRDFYLTK